MGGWMVGWIGQEKALAVFTCPRSDVVKVAWETEVFNASTAKCALRQRSRLVGLVHGKSDGCERETAFESISAQLCPWCKDIAVICFLADANLTEGAALRKHPSAVLDTARGHEKKGGDGRTDGRMDGWVDGWMDGMDG